MVYGGREALEQMNLTRDQIVRYWQTRLDGQRVNWGSAKVSVGCPLHDSKTGTPLTVFLDGNSGFSCNGCNRKGNLFQFESMFSGCTVQEAEGKVAEITGAKPQNDNGWQWIASYDYRDAQGKTLFQKRRYKTPDGRSFPQYRPNGKGGWDRGIDPPGARTKRVLYHLPDLITANVVCLCEGEKDCETIDSLRLYADNSDLRVATTTNFDGAWQPGQASKWLAEYNPYVTGKFVLIFQDNDAAGEAWAQHIAAAIYPFAERVKIIKLPALPLKGDVTDWIEAGHTAAELMEQLKSTREWHPAKDEAAPQRIFLNAIQFWNTVPDTLEWWVDGVIQKGANGFIAGEPGASKSFLTVDLAVCLATGQSWLDRKVTEAIKVGVVSREDTPALTSWRSKRLALAKGNKDVLEMCQQNLWFSTRQQRGELLLNDESHVQELICEIRERQLKLVFFDVFSVLHTCDEDKMREMAPIFESLRRIQREAGSAVAIVHHFNKLKEGSITQKLRGTSGFGGFAEWILAVELVDVEKKYRRVGFGKVKAGPEDKPVTYKIVEGDGVVRMEVVHLDQVASEPPHEQNTRRRDGEPGARLQMPRRELQIGK
jgi:AAA domain